MIKVRQNLVSPSKYGIKCPYTMKAEYITFHNTANDATADGEIKYMISNNSQVSYHYAVDDKEVVQGVSTDRIAWHCGDGRGNGNMKSIGVEVCYSKSGGEKYEKAEELGIQFIAQLLHERNWNVDRVKPHKFWSGKNCPHRILDDKRWDSVLNRINKALQNLKSNSSNPMNKGYLMEGDNGEVVGQLQKNLNILGAKLVVDNNFGESTKQFLMSFQLKNGLEADGFYGLQSQKKMTQLIEELNKVVNKPEPQPKENTDVKGVSIRMFKPTRDIFTKDLVELLEKASRDKIITSAEWKEKAEKGELPLDDVIGLIASYLNRTIK